MAIKISDISVGDWVEWKVYDKSYDILVTQITDTLIRGVHDGIEYGMLLKQISPIPITPEILEGNGFEPPRVGIGFDTWFWSNRRDMALELRRYVNDKWQLAYQIKDKVQAHLLFPLYHIHELQHIIRLLHIDKEIVIHKKQ